MTEIDQLKARIAAKETELQRWRERDLELCPFNDGQPYGAVAEIARLKARESQLLAASNRELERRRIAEDKANGATAMLAMVTRDIGNAISFGEFVQEKLEWSLRTFGPGVRTEAVCRHIEKELAEIRREPHDLVEWIDVILLAIDGYCRAGGSPWNLLRDLQAKHAVNQARKWPTSVDGQPVEHVRGEQ